MFSNIKIGKRLIIGFSVALIGLTIVSFIGVNSLSSLNDEVEVLIHDRIPKIVWTNDIIDQINVNARVVRNIALTDDPAIVKKEMERLPFVRC